MRQYNEHESPFADFPEVRRPFAQSFVGAGALLLAQLLAYGLPSWSGPLLGRWPATWAIWFLAVLLMMRVTANTSTPRDKTERWLLAAGLGGGLGAATGALVSFFLLGLSLIATLFLMIDGAGRPIDPGETSLGVLLLYPLWGTIIGGLSGCFGLALSSKTTR